MNLYKKLAKSLPGDFPKNRAGYVEAFIDSGDAGMFGLTEVIQNMPAAERKELATAVQALGPAATPQDYLERVGDILYGAAEDAGDVADDAGDAVNITPSAQAYADENGIDVTTLAGTGKGGKITLKDVKAAGKESPAERPSGLRNKQPAEDEVMESGLPPTDNNSGLADTPDQSREMLKSQYGFTDDQLQTMDDESVAATIESFRQQEETAKASPPKRRGRPPKNQQQAPAPQQAQRPTFDPETEAYLNSMEPQGPAMFGMRQGDAAVPVEEDIDALAGEVGRPDLMRGDATTPAEAQGGLFASAGPEKLEQAIDQAIAADDQATASFRTDDPEMMRLFDELSKAQEPQATPIEQLNFRDLFGPGGGGDANAYGPFELNDPRRRSSTVSPYGPFPEGDPRAPNSFDPDAFGPYPLYDPRRPAAELDYSVYGPLEKGDPREFAFRRPVAPEPDATDSRFNDAGGVGSEPYGPEPFKPDPKRPVGSRMEQFLKKRGLEGMSLRPATAPLDAAYRNPIGAAVGLGAAGTLGYGLMGGFSGGGNEPLPPEQEAELQQRYEAARAKVEEMYGGGGRQRLRKPDGTDQSL